jgi:hypothetical protein
MSRVLVADRHALTIVISATLVESGRTMVSERCIFNDDEPDEYPDIIRGTRRKDWQQRERRGRPK